MQILFVKNVRRSAQLFVATGLLILLLACGGSGGSSNSSSASTLAVKRQILALVDDSEAFDQNNDSLEPDTLNELQQTWAYLATWPDLIYGFGPDLATAAAHLIKYGNGEDRPLQAPFDASAYMEENEDVADLCTLQAPQDTISCAAEHYVRSGFKDGRSWSDLTALLYISSYPDLIQSIGFDTDAGRAHYLQYGKTQGRKISFNVVRWLKLNPLIKETFEGNFEGALRYFIVNGNTLPSPSQDFWIVNKSGECLTPHYYDVTTEGQPMKNWTCNPTRPQQRWRLGGDNQLHSAFDPNKCIGTSSADASIDDYVQVRSCTSEFAQTWQISAGNQIAIYKSDETNFCLNTLNGNVTFGTLATIRSCGESENHEWRLVAMPTM